MKYLDYPEQQKHRGQDFPYFFYHVTWIHPRYNMPYHWHPLWEIVHVFSGHFHLHLDHDDLLLSPGDSAFISPVSFTAEPHRKLRDAAMNACFWIRIIFFSHP